MKPNPMMAASENKERPPIGRGSRRASPCFTSQPESAINRS